ncbi:hypothetical protein A0J61_06765 [Choanephora cucurbitarum]|uniref:Uncharacterized protein n=1 Tax=Choanephora cucurbitarum TaxID=101091 RepID=A0A1C7N7Y2_9FUNG|nr:hypothetical protein A0J61_06765 [Choanephora cucurbitarum]
MITKLAYIGESVKNLLLWTATGTNKIKQCSKLIRLTPNLRTLVTEFNADPLYRVALKETQKWSLNVPSLFR